MLVSFFRVRFVYEKKIDHFIAACMLLHSHLNVADRIGIFQQTYTERENTFVSVHVTADSIGIQHTHTICTLQEIGRIKSECKRIRREKATTQIFCRLQFCGPLLSEPIQAHIRLHKILG